MKPIVHGIYTQIPLSHDLAALGESIRYYTSKNTSCEYCKLKLKMQQWYFYMRINNFYCTINLHYKMKNKEKTTICLCGVCKPKVGARWKQIPELSSLHNREDNPQIIESATWKRGNPVKPIKIIQIFKKCEAQDSKPIIKTTLGKFPDASFFINCIWTGIRAHAKKWIDM